MKVFEKIKKIQYKIFPREKSSNLLLVDIAKEQKAMGELLVAFVHTPTNPAEYVRKADVIENRGDEATAKLLKKLNQAFITSFDREDIFHLAHEMDDVIDIIEDSIGNISNYNCARISPAMKKFADLIGQAIDVLGEMVERMNGADNHARLESLKEVIHALENHGDTLHADEIKRIFAHDNEPMTVAKYKEEKIIEGLENVLDKLNHISNLIVGIVMKSS